MESATVPKVVVTASLLAAAAVGWALTGDRMHGMDHGPGTELGALDWFMVSWVLMMAAMMLPSLAPAALSRTRAQFGALPAFVVGYLGAWTAAGLAGYVIFEAVRSLGLGFLAWDQAGRYVAAGAILAAAGYLLAWSAAGLVAYALIEAVRSLHLGFLSWDEAGRYVAGGAILAAALFQLTSVKDACLRRCRDPQAARNGLEHGAHCIACCWALMAALFALGVMSIAWMAVVAALIAAERLLPSKLMAKQAVAVVLVVLGMSVALAPGQVPGLTLPDSQDAAGMTMKMQQ